ncbi:hypothetical protein BD560DRAFT_391503 [Blakeslea trispora]|nr:hypothetical protein BD560DRAFT_391503 [Blakeslea trispora]
MLFLSEGFKSLGSAVQLNCRDLGAIPASTEAFSLWWHLAVALSSAVLQLILSPAFKCLISFFLSFFLGKYFCVVCELHILTHTHSLF